MFLLLLILLNTTPTAYAEDESAESADTALTTSTTTTDTGDTTSTDTTDTTSTTSSDDEFYEPAPGFGGKVNSLTDSEKILSENYVHEGLSKRRMDEACAGGNKEACDGKAATVFNGSWDVLAESAAKAYGMFMGPAGPKMDLRGADEASKKAAELKDDRLPEKDKERTDYCGYIPMATETISTAMQIANRNEINNLQYSNETSQKDYLYKAAKVHKTRAEAATYQTYGWGATTACYGAMYATGTTLGSTWWRFGAAGLLTTFFYHKMEAHKEYEDEVNAIADAMPGKGDCNPITQRDCYCSQEETKNDPQYCLERMKAQLAVDLKLEHCVDKYLVDDPECTCRTNNTCFSVKTMDLGEGWDLGTAFTSGVGAPLKRLTSGAMTGAELSNGTLNNLAMAKQALAKFDSKIPLPTGTLNKKQKRDAGTLLKMGFSPRLASKFASLPLTNRAKELKDQLLNGMKTKRYSKRRTRPKSGVFYISKKRKNKAKVKDESFDPYKLLKKKRKKKHSSGVIHLSNLALQRAQISRNKSSNIFDRISIRYKKTLWRQIDVRSTKSTK